MCNHNHDVELIGWYLRFHLSAAIIECSRCHMKGRCCYLDSGVFWENIHKDYLLCVNKYERVELLPE